MVCLIYKLSTTAYWAGRGGVSTTCRRCQVFPRKLVVAGNDGEVWMPDRSVFTAFPSKAGTF